MFRIIHYWPLIFLILIPYLIYISQKSLMDAAPWRKTLTLCIRILALLLLILALTDLQLKRRSEILSVVFLVDVSDSISVAQRKTAVHLLDDAIDNLKDNDEFAIVTFAADATTQTPLQPKLLAKDWDSRQLLSDTDMLSPDDTQYTNIAKGVRLALSLFPEAHQKRIVLFSDGNQNSADVRGLADVARASGVEIDTLPLSVPTGPEVLIHNLRVPSRVRVGEPFKIQILIESTRETTARIHISRNGQLIPHEASSEASIDSSRLYKLSPGKQLFYWQQRLDSEGTYEYEATIATEKTGADTIKANNTAYGLVTVGGNPKVLYVENNIQYAQPLHTVLLQTQIDVTVIEPKEMPRTLTDLQSYDAVIFSNVSAEQISEDTMQLIERYVRDVGKGVIMIGGNRSFGQGGYFDTPIERALPVEMSPQKKQSLALILLLDKSGSMANYSDGVQKMEIALKATQSVIEMETLKEEDVIGVIAFDAQIKSLITEAEDKEKLSEWVRALGAGSGTDMYKALEHAHEQLKNITNARSHPENRGTKQKHVVILSDGKSPGDFVPLAQRMADDKITISTIAIGDADKALMENIAIAGKGRSRYVANFSRLPQILVEEVRKTQELIVEGEFQPRIVNSHEILTGITSVPELRGYVATSEKESAEVSIVSPENHPILATWRYGLGKSIAFTSDVKSLWAEKWIQWENFGKFWTQAVNWVLSSAISDDYDVTVSPPNSGEFGYSTARVVVETFSESEESTDALSHPETHLEFHGRVAVPNAEGQKLDFRQTAPSRYEAAFEVNHTGAYLVTVNKLIDGQSVSQQRTSLVVPYSPEFATLQPNLTLLRRLAEDSGGLFNPTPKRVGRHTGSPTEKSAALWGVFALCAILLFPCELAIRRLHFSTTQISAAFEKIPFIGKGRRQKFPQAEIPSLARLRQRKSEVFSAARHSEVKFAPDGYQQSGSMFYQETQPMPSESIPTGDTSQTDTPFMARLLKAKKRANV